jgi:hypothetical protein
MKLRCLVPNSYIHISMSDLYILRIGLHGWSQRNWQTNPRNRSQMNVETKNNEAKQFYYKSEPDFYIGFSPALHLQCSQGLRIWPKIQYD